MTTPVNHLYRSILRELRLTSRKSRTTRNPTMVIHLRTLISQNPSNVETALLETRDFLRASRIHAELLKRYNPWSDITDEERIRLSARRVGLNTPVEYKPE